MSHAWHGAPAFAAAPFALRGRSLAARDADTPRNDEVLDPEAPTGAPMLAAEELTVFISMMRLEHCW